MAQLNRSSYRREYYGFSHCLCVLWGFPLACPRDTKNEPSDSASLIAAIERLSAKAQERG
jgi:hypothetical protein